MELFDFPAQLQLYKYVASTYQDDCQNEQPTVDHRFCRALWVLEAPVITYERQGQSLQLNDPHPTWESGDGFSLSLSQVEK